MKTQRLNLRKHQLQKIFGAMIHDYQILMTNNDKHNIDECALDDLATNAELLNALVNEWQYEAEQARLVHGVAKAMKMESLTINK